MWRILNPDWTCQGRKQSPINIDPKAVVPDHMVNNIALKVTPPNRPLAGVLRNNGHAPTLSISPDMSVKLQGANLMFDYYLKQLHFHFGCDNDQGSEHRIDNQPFPLEVNHCLIFSKGHSEFSSTACKIQVTVNIGIYIQRNIS